MIDTNWEDIQQCEKCHRFKRKIEFYSFKDGTKDCFCKDCIKEGIYDWDVDTFILKLKRYDVPYIEEEWNNMRARQSEKVCKNNAKYSTIFGKYLSRMNLFATKHLRFNNSATDWKETKKLFEELYESED